MNKHVSKKKSTIFYKGILIYDFLFLKNISRKNISYCFQKLLMKIPYNVMKFFAQIESNFARSIIRNAEKR